MLDVVHEEISRYPQDTNTYTLRRIGVHNAVIACLPKGQYGKTNAATVSNNMAQSFPRILHRLMAGNGGGVPGTADIRLGDIVVSIEVVQYDLGKAMPEGQFERIAYPVRPPQIVITEMAKPQASHSRDQSYISALLHEYNSLLPHYTHPELQDGLFYSEYNHVFTKTSCDGCNHSRVIPRQVR